MIIHDSAGRIEVAMSKTLHMSLGPLETEAMALAEGVRFTREVGICDMVFEGDYKVVLDAVWGYVTPPATIATVIFKAVKILHVK